MLSDEKISHIVNLMLDRLEKDKFLTLSDRGSAVREAKKVCVLFSKHIAEATDAARNRISSQKNPPPMGSPQWENLYQKYYEEELNKRGG